MTLDRTGALFAALARGPASAAALLPALGVSQPTLSRLIRDADRRVLRIGRGRATQYALPRSVGTYGSAWPIYRVNERGRSDRVATLHAISPDRFWYESSIDGALLETSPNGLFGDLPWFLSDLRPQGFLGRAFARRHGPPLGFPEDPRLWSADNVIVALLLYGDDLPGDFVLGERAVAHAQELLVSPTEPIPEKQRSMRYPELAEAALQGAAVGSSAAGEQPKFTAAVASRAGVVRQVIVKMSPPDTTPAGRRWGDLLRCEHLAHQALIRGGIPASESAIITADRRTFLEVTRFDRVGAVGRRGVVSLFATDAELFGKLDDWVHAGERLAAAGWLSEEDANRLAVLWWFGELIGNTDKHFGNVSLFLGDRKPLALAPAYDMVPMAYQPTSTGELLQRDEKPSLPPPEQFATWQRAATLAVEFWEAVMNDPHVSRSFGNAVHRRPRAIRDVMERLR
jgi:hypothetical protein